MKTSDWKTVAELVGIAAIVASLVFVGEQLRQDRKIAYAEAVADLLDNRLETRMMISEYAHVLAKGNSGAELNDAESMIIRNIVQSERDRVFLLTWRAEVIGESFSNTPELMFAVFLYQNPTARDAWRGIAADMDTLIDPLRTPDSLERSRRAGSAAFRERVKQHLAKLDQLDD